MREIVETPVELNRLVRVEGVNAPAAPARHAVGEDRRNPVAQLERLQLEPVHEAKAQQQPFECGWRLPGGTPANGVHVRPAVERALEHELDERLQVELMRRHPENDARDGVGRVAHAARVADGAVQSDVIDALAAASRHADGQIVARLEQEPERRVPARQLLPADRGQRGEDLVRRQHSAHGTQQRDAGLAADRAILEMIGD